jgi:hypothetical protein
MYYSHCGMKRGHYNFEKTGQDPISDLIREREEDGHLRVIAIPISP